MTDGDVEGGILECGMSIEQLSDYLAHDRVPYDPTIEECPECTNALHALERVAQLSRDLITEDARTLPAPPAAWFDDILANIRVEMRAGRDLPLHHPDPRVSLGVTEGAVRTLLREIGDGIPGVLIGACRIHGDAETSGAPVRIEITASIAVGVPLQPLVERLRDDTLDALRRHTELNIEAVDITVADLHDASGRE